MTRRLNQDVLENLFSFLKGMMSSSYQLTPLEFKFWSVKRNYKFLYKNEISQFNISV